MSNLTYVAPFPIIPVMNGRAGMLIYQRRTRMRCTRNIVPRGWSFISPCGSMGMVYLDLS